MSVMVGIFLMTKTHIPITQLDLGTMGISNTVGFLVILGFGIMVAPDLWQRIFATKDEKNLRR